MTDLDRAGLEAASSALARSRQPYDVEACIAAYLAVAGSPADDCAVPACSVPILAGVDDLVIIDSSKVSDKAKARTLLVLHEVNEDGEPVSAGGGEIAA